MRHRVLVSLAVSGLLSLSGFGCAQDPSQAQASNVADVTYRLSTNGREEILFVAFLGGGEPLTARYHLYGDGRLVRDLFDQGRELVLRTDEVELPAAEMERLTRSLVEARLPGLTAERLRQAAGGRVPPVEDGGYVLVRFQFESYHQQGKALKARFAAAVSLPSPSSLASNHADFPEARAAAGLFPRLDGYFSEPFEKASGELSGMLIALSQEKP